MGAADTGGVSTVTVAAAVMPLPPLRPLGGAGGAGADLLSMALPLLRAEDEPVLGFWIEAGVLAGAALSRVHDPVARREFEVVRSLGERSLERMTRSNIRLVYHWVSRSWAGRDTGGLDVEDLAAVGVEGLIHAIWMWDYRRGLKFSTYASYWIRQYLDRAVTRSRSGGFTSVDTERVAELFRVRAALESRLGRGVTTRELADALEVSVAAVKDLQFLERNVRAMVRLDKPVAADSAVTVGDLLVHPGPSSDQVVVDGELRAELTAALQGLSWRERAVLMARVGWSGPALGEEEVAARFGVSVAQVRSTTQGALTRLRGMLGDSWSGGAAA